MLLPLLGDQIVSTHFSQYAVRVIYALVWATVCLSLAWNWFYLPTQAGLDTRLGTMVPVALGSVVFSALRGSSRRSSLVATRSGHHVSSPRILLPNEVRRISLPRTPARRVRMAAS